MRSRDFFIDDPDLLTRFESWLFQKGVRPSTYVVYRGMLARLVVWSQLEGCGPRLTDTALKSFFAGRSLSAMTRHRYLLLLSAWLEFEAVCRREGLPKEVNPARRLLLEKPAPEPEPPRVLGQLERDNLLTGLGRESASPNWKHARTAGAIAVLLGCGLTARETVTLRMEDVLENADFCALRIRRNGFQPERVVPFVDPVPSGVFSRWLVRRRKENIPGALVFPGAPSGAPLVHSTLYRSACRAASKFCGHDACPVTLRNTFAVWAANKGVPHGQIQLWMGHLHARATGRILGSGGQ